MGFGFGGECVAVFLNPCDFCIDGGFVGGEAGQYWAVDGGEVGLEEYLFFVWDGFHVTDSFYVDF
jgi:hypothetical protein